MTETMVNGMKFRVWNDTTKRATFAEREDGRVEMIHGCGYITVDLTIRKAIAMVFGLPTFRKNAKKVVAENTTTVESDTESEQSVETAEQIQAEEQKTQFDFYNVTIGFEVEKFIGTIYSAYESLGIYSNYEKAVQAAQAAADEYGAENIYFHTVKIATRNDREIYDREDYEFFINERETIRHHWYTLTIVDTGKREHVNLDKPVRLDFEE